MRKIKIIRNQIIRNKDNQKSDHQKSRKQRTKISIKDEQSKGFFEKVNKLARL